jgi:hypothetical protein
MSADDTVTDYDITEAMIVFGGGFVSGLGRLWRVADTINRHALKDAFPAYWASYADPVMHAALRQRERAR